MQVGYAKIAILDQYLASSRVNAATAMCYTQPVCITLSVRAAPDHGKLVTLIAGKRSCLLFAGDRRPSAYAMKPQRYAEENRT